MSNRYLISYKVLDIQGLFIIKLIPRAMRVVTI